MFQTPIEVRFRHQEIGGSTLSEIRYHDEATGLTIHVPVGFDCDFGSVPVIFQGLVPRVGRMAGAYIVHDWLYRNCGKVRNNNGLLVEISRKDADRIMLEAMAKLKVAWWRRRLAYLGVRIGAGLAWRSYCEPAL